MTEFSLTIRNRLLFIAGASLLATIFLMPSVRGDSFFAPPGQTFEVPKGASALELSYTTVSGGKNFYPEFSWSTDCAHPFRNNPPPDEQASPYSVTLTAGAESIAAESGTMQPPSNVVIHNQTCPVNQPVPPGEVVPNGVPGTPSVHITRYDVSRLTRDGPVTVQFDANGVFATVSVIATPPMFLQFEISSDPGRPFTVEKLVTSTNLVAAQVPLGTIFSVKLVRKDRDTTGNATIIPVDSIYSDGADSIAPRFKNNFSIFTTSTMVKLSGDTSAGRSLTYGAVHMGKHSLVMLPSTIAGASSVTVNIEIIRPTALGTTHNEFDERIVDAAHETGMLPQFMKGQIQQESKFDRTSFRYEPCSWDFAQVSAGVKRITTDPYKAYAMDPALSIPGLSATIDLRDSLYVPDGTIDQNSNIGIRHIRTGETGVTAKNIWIASDVRPSGPGAGRGEKWSQQGCEALDTFLQTHSFAEFLDALDFAAQTPTASSYGLMQVMWGLVEDYRWSVDDPDHPGQTTQSPRYLVDTPEAIALERGGSILIGSQEDVQRYWNFWAPATESSVFASQAMFYNSFKTPLRMYTGGGRGSQDYGTNIIDTYQFSYLPKVPATFFP